MNVHSVIFYNNCGYLSKNVYSRNLFGLLLNVFGAVYISVFVQYYNKISKYRINGCSGMCVVASDVSKQFCF